MNTEIRGKGVKVTEDIKTYVNQKLSKLDRFTTRKLDAKVIFKLEGKMVKTEVTIPISTLVLRAEVIDQDLKIGVDKCLDKLEKQLKSNRYKIIRSLKKKQGTSDIFVDNTETKEDVNSAVKIKQYKLEVLTFDEAVTELELTDHTFYAYKNEKGNTCIVYLRADNEYGLIETF